MERLSDQCFMRIDNERVAVIAIQRYPQVEEAFHGAIERISRAVRVHDLVLLMDDGCLIVLPETSFLFAEELARRLCILLVKFEYGIQILSGLAAQTLLQMKYRGQELFLIEPGDGGGDWPVEHDEDDLLPYLAFLEHYPAPRLFHLFPYEFACHYRCVPLGAERGVLTLATSKRLDAESLTHLQASIQRRIFQVRCDLSLIEDVLRYWQCNLMLTVTEGVHPL